MAFPDHPFWDFSLRVYGTEGVSAACLDLQERHGVDVNILLFCLWLGAAGYPARSETQLRAIAAAASLWHDQVVKPLRAVRRRLKEPIEPVDHGLAQEVRARLQKVEIEAEHLEQLTLAGLIAGERPKSLAAAVQRENGISNLLIYLDILEAELDADSEERLRIIEAAAFPAP